MNKDDQTIKFTGRIVAGAYYDFQELRKGTMSRIRDIVRKIDEGIPFDEVEEKKSVKEERAIEKAYADKNLPEILNNLLSEGKIDDKNQGYVKNLLDATHEVVKTENRYKKLMMDYVEAEPIYDVFLKHIHGVGPVLSANMIKEFGYCNQTYRSDVVDEDSGKVVHKEGEEKCPHVSSLWRLCGQDVVDGQAPCRRKGESINYSPRLKTLAWKISDSLMKQRTPYYRGLYDGEKDSQLARMQDCICRYCGNPLAEVREELDEDSGKTVKAIEYVHVKARVDGKTAFFCSEDRERQVTNRDFKVSGGGKGTPPYSLGHAHNRALRYMRKRFLEHYWVCARELAGLEAGRPWQFEHEGGHKHYEGWRLALKANMGV